MMRKTIVAVALVALLAACDSGTEETSDGRTAEGEVLGGTISDAMLPLDTVQSQSPPLRTEPTGEEAGAEAVADGDAAAEPAEEADDDAAAEEAEPAPEPQPAPAAPAPDDGAGDDG